MAKTKANITEWMTQVIVSPVVTEKASVAGERGQVVFNIAPDATKVDVKKAVEAMYGVTVTKVNTVNIAGKVKRFRGIIGKRNDIRKAYVTLKDGDNIDLGTGI